MHAAGPFLVISDTSSVHDPNGHEKVMTVATRPTTNCTQDCFRSSLTMRILSYKLKLGNSINCCNATPLYVVVELVTNIIKQTYINVGSDTTFTAALKDQHVVSFIHAHDARFDPKLHPRA